MKQKQMGFPAGWECKREPNRNKVSQKTAGTVYALYYEGEFVTEFDTLRDAANYAPKHPEGAE